MYISQLAATAWKDDIRLDDDGIGAQLSDAASAAGKQLGVRIVVTAAEAPPASAGWSISPRRSEPAEAAASDASESAAPAPADSSVVAAPASSSSGIQLLMFPEMTYLLAQDLAHAAVMVSDYYQDKITGVPLTTMLCGGPAALPAQASDTAGSSGGVAPTERTAHSRQVASLQLGQLPAIVCVCAHKRRDKRCGLAGPMLIDEFRRVVEARGLTGQVHVVAVSHIGGVVARNDPGSFRPHPPPGSSCPVVIPC
ncbi:MAG: hypothetical protein WDW38_001783 [Sanguina aurantia]